MLRAVSVALGVGLVAVASSPALALGPERLKAHIPFAFSVDNVTLPPGDYRIKPLSDLDSNVVEIRSTDGHHAVLVMTENTAPENRTAQTELVFDRVGTRDFLRAIRVPEETGATVPRTRTEIDAVRTVALSHEAPSAAHKASS
jgi:hypothetical protein